MSLSVVSPHHDSVSCEHKTEDEPIDLRINKQTKQQQQQQQQQHSEINEASSNRVECVYKNSVTSQIRDLKHDDVDDDDADDNELCDDSDTYELSSKRLKKCNVVQVSEDIERYGATDSCKRVSCVYRDLKTTHFHCVRPSCAFTFKNKSDIERHRAYHERDESLQSEGFKKFMKYEKCAYSGCPHSHAHNHIHCVRPGCMYVLHSMGQLISHKRKHERRERTTNKRADDGIAVRNVSADDVTAQNRSDHVTQSQSSTPHRDTTSSSDHHHDKANDDDDDADDDMTLSRDSQSIQFIQNQLVTSLSHRVMTSSSCGNTSRVNKRQRDESWIKYLKRYTANDPCRSTCVLLYKDHYHCRDARCTAVYKSKDRVREHAKQHEQQDRIKIVSFIKFSDVTPCVSQSCAEISHQIHYHCTWPGCTRVIRAYEHMFSRLDHHKWHEQWGSRTLEPLPSSALTVMTPPALMLGLVSKRKRGRPRKSEVRQVQSEGTEERDEVMGGDEIKREVAAGFEEIKKEPLSEDEMLNMAVNPGEKGSVECRGQEGLLVVKDKKSKECVDGFIRYEADELCGPVMCYLVSHTHYHCCVRGCYFSSQNESEREQHRLDMHGDEPLTLNFEFYDRGFDCGRESCAHSKTSKHYHCVQCEYSFVRHGTMLEHERTHSETSQTSKQSHSQTLENCKTDSAVQKSRSVMLHSSESNKALSTDSINRASPLQVIRTLDLPNIIQNCSNAHTAQSAAQSNNAKDSISRLSPVPLNNTQNNSKASLRVSTAGSHISSTDGSHISNTAASRVNSTAASHVNSTAASHVNSTAASHVSNTTSSQHIHATVSHINGSQCCIKEIRADTRESASSSPAFNSEISPINVQQVEKIDSHVKITSEERRIELCESIEPRDTIRVLGHVISSRNCREDLHQVLLYKNNSSRQDDHMMRTAYRTSRGTVTQQDALHITGEQDVLVDCLRGTSLESTCSPGALEDQSKEADKSITVTQQAALQIKVEQGTPVDCTRGACYVRTGGQSVLVEQCKESGRSSGGDLHVDLWRRNDCVVAPHETDEPAVTIRVHRGVQQNCGQPFCKLKKKDHYHCSTCNQASTDLFRLLHHTRSCQESVVIRNNNNNNNIVHV